MQPARSIPLVVQFVLILSGIVACSFLLVYALLGWVLEGPALQRWAREAASVGAWVGTGLTIVTVLVVAISYALGGRVRQLLHWVLAGQCLFAWLQVALIALFSVGV